MVVSSSTNEADTPFVDITHFRSLIGALQYLAITRPDIQFAVNRVAQRMHQPSEHDYHCLKCILRYIFGTLGRGLLIRPGDLELRGFSDSDWANDKNDRKSTSRSAGTLNLSQELYIKKVLSRFRVNDAKPRTTPLANHFKLSKEQSPKIAEERDHMTLGFVDANLCGDVKSSKITSAYIYTIVGTTVNWMSRLQKCVSLSSTEVEYVVIAEAGKEMI
uniref:Reverse transcriptase Ty1/copia-type domain-containing protein n=1 Tax=Solanum lycopersicum TaxID=4081 RepID=A0A3Q7I5V1_SOLLC